MFSQIPVTDVAANANLVIINTQIASVLTALGTIEGTLGGLEGNSVENSATNIENTSTNVENLAESVTQSETMIAQLEEIQEIQEQLNTVKQAIKDAKQVKESLIYIVKIIRDTNYILTQTNSLKYRDGRRVFSSNDIDQINEVFDTVLNTVNGFMDVIQKVIKDDVFKMDEGNRLELILNMAEKIKIEFTRIHSKRIEFENSFRILTTTPIKG